MKLQNKIQNLILLKKTVKIPIFTYINNKSFFSNKKKL